jgi:hypothetical protein
MIAGKLWHLMRTEQGERKRCKEVAIYIYPRPHLNIHEHAVIRLSDSLEHLPNAY